MNKFLFCAIIFLSSFNHFLLAQHSPGPDDIARAMRGGRVSIHSSKSLLEAGEQAVLNINLLIAPDASQQTPETAQAGYDIPMPDGSDPNMPAAYKAGNWHVVQGGGSVSGIQGNNCVYTAPSAAPPDRTMVISVDLNPASNVLPKIVLLQTLYFVADQNAIVVNLPQGGFNNEKYVSQTNGGTKVPTMQGMDPRVAAQMDANMQAKMTQAQQAVNAAQQNTGINLAAITSNAMAYYDGNTDITAVRFMQLSPQMVDGKIITTNSSAGMQGIGGITMCVISFKGHGKGMYKLDDKSSGVTVQEGLKRCGCGNNNQNGQGDEAPCNGYINITTVENGVMKGDFSALVYTADGNGLVHGYIYGKFAVNVANAQ